MASSYSLYGKYKRALVTGGAGFIGSHIVEDLLNDGLEVVSLDNYSAGHPINVKHCHKHSTFAEITWDITKATGLDRFFEGVDIVFHEACSKNTACVRDPLRDLAINGLGTLHVLMAAKNSGVKKFVHASSGSVYGEPVAFPTNEDHQLDPVSYYGVSKLAGDRYARLFTHLFDMDVTILRYYHVFGPRQDHSEVGGVVSIFGRRALENKPIIIYGDGTQLRSFTYVKDIVNISKLVALEDGTKSQAFNCASGIKVTINELANAVREYFQKPDLQIKYED